MSISHSVSLSLSLSFFVFISNARNTHTHTHNYVNGRPQEYGARLEENGRQQVTIELKTQHNQLATYGTAAPIEPREDKPFHTNH